MGKVMICKVEDAPIAMQQPTGRKMFSSEGLGIVHLTLNPGENIAVHTNPFRGYFLCAFRRRNA